MATTSVVTNAGRAQITAKLVSNGPGFMGFGKNTGATTAAATDTALNAEISNTDESPGTYSRPATTLSQQTTTVTNDTLQAVATFTHSASASGSVNVGEVGTFDASTSGNMWFRSTFTAIALSPGFGLQATCSTVEG